MNKTELISAAAESAGVTKKDAEKVLNAALEAITASLCQGNKIQISNFGAFEVKERSARTARNLHTGEVVEIPATRVPTFKPCKALKDTIAR